MATPALPALMNTSYANAVAPGCKTIAVPSGGDLQQALNKAKQGDLITLAAGATFTGNFTLPAAKGGPKTIRIQSSAPLTPEGTRVSIADAAAFPKIITPNSGAAIQLAPGAANWRIANVEVTSTSTPVNGYLIGLGTGSETNKNDFPHHIVIDRSYIHGSAANGGRRGVMFSGNYQAVIDSYLSDWKEVGADTQAICGWTGYGPFKVVNNYIEGAGENLMFGGSDTGITNLTPSDIEVRDNLFFKPLSWKISDPSYAGTPWRIKNSFELKHAKRVLIEDNIFENNWIEGQNGFAIVFTVRNQSGGNPWATVADVTFRRNTIRKSACGVNMLGRDFESGTPSDFAKRLLIERNLFYDIGLEEGGILFQFVWQYDDVTIDHNTAIHTGTIIVADGDPSLGFKFTNNITEHNLYGILGSGFGSGNAAIAHYFPGSTIRRNIIVMNTGDFSSQYPTDNFYPASLNDVGFVDLVDNADLRLAPSSIYNNAATDVTDVGADLPTPA